MVAIVPKRTSERYTIGNLYPGSLATVKAPTSFFDPLTGRCVLNSLFGSSVYSLTAQFGILNKLTASWGMRCAPGAFYSCRGVIAV